MSDRVTRTVAALAVVISVVGCAFMYRLEQRAAVRHDQAITALSQLVEDLNNRVAGIEATPAETEVETADIVIEDNWRVSTIPVPTTSVVMVQPGNWVDVLSRVQGTDSKGEVTMTLFEGVRVMSIQRRSADGRSVVSLILTPPQAKMLTVLVDHAEFHLVLRPPGDRSFAPIDLPSVPG